MIRQKNLQDALVCVAEILYANQSAEDMLTQVGQIIQEWIPYDHMRFVLPVISKQYELGADGLMEFKKYNPQNWRGDRRSANHWVLYHQLPILRHNVVENLQFEADEKLIPQGLVAQLVVPLMSDKECVGALNFISKTPQAFTDSHLETAQLFARLVAAGVQQIYLRKEMYGIGEISRAVQATNDLDQILNLILEHICSLGYDRVRVYLYEEDEDVLVGAVQVGSELKRDFTHIRFSVANDEYTQKTFQGLGACIYHQPEKDPDVSKVFEGVLVRLSPQCWADLPLYVFNDGRKKIVGKISLDNIVSGRALDQKKLDRLMDYASQAAIAIRQVQRYDEVSLEVARRTEALVATNQQLEEREHWIQVFHGIGHITLSCRNVRDVLHQLKEHLLNEGIFRSLTTALVNNEMGFVELVRLASLAEGDYELPDTVRYDLTHKDPFAECVRTGQVLVIDEWDERFNRDFSSPQDRQGKVAYFIPVKQEGCVLAVLATGSYLKDKESMLVRIGAMGILLDQVAIALEHASLYEKQEEREKELVQQLLQKEALQQLSHSIQQMNQSNELGDLARLYLKTIQNMGVNAQAVAIHRVIDAEQNLIETFRLCDNGYTIDTGIREGISIVQLWREGNIHHDSHLESIPDVARFRQKFQDLPINCFLSVPFSMGVISVHSIHKGAFSDRDVDILKQVAEIFSVGIKRLEDLEALETQYKISRESEARYRNLIRLIDGVVYALDWESKKYTYMDESVYDLVGYRPEELDHHLCQSLIEDEMELTRFESISPYIQSFGSDRPTVFRSEYTLNTRAGKKVRVVDCALEFRDKAGNLLHTLGILLNVTEQRVMEEGLRQSQKMEAIGQLAGGVAHDFNNLLTGILGLTSLLLAQLQKEDPMWKDIEDIQKASRRAADLTKQLLAFSRKQMIEPVVLDVNRVISDMQSMLRRLIREDIELVISLALVNKPIKMDRGQFEQIIMNLVVNAKDAMSQGGKLLIKTNQVVLDTNQVRFMSSLTPGRFVTIEVQDTGLGMDDETMAHIFEPFFTTKKEGQGTGLGLATVYGIVAQNGGHIVVDSKKDEGSVFLIYLPQVDQVADEDLDESVKELLEGHETILVAEDEEIVRQLVVRILTNLGYDVLIAKNGQEALRIWQAHDKPIDLLLTDVVMPGGGGIELAKTLREQCHNLPVIYMSGYAEDLMGHESMSELTQVFMQKPFTLDMLSQTVRNLLDAQANT